MGVEITETQHDGTTITGTHYRCLGPVRGWCGHRHTSLPAAGRCRELDSIGCTIAGGYSDRAICLCDDEGHVSGYTEW